MRAHLSRTGNWRNCKSENCRMRFHLPLEAKDAAALPKPVLYGLLEVFDEPNRKSEFLKQWVDKDGRMHRDYDLPAYIGTDGTWGWYQHGMLHRDEDKPAIIRADGTREWYFEGRIHRNDLPARILPDGTGEYYDHGHRWLRDADL